MAGDVESGGDRGDRLMVVGLGVVQVLAGRERGPRPALQRDAVVGAVEAAGGAAVLLVAEHVGQVLDQGATERDVEHLHPTADPEHRHVALHRAAHERDLGLVALRDGAVRRRVGLGAVQRRIDVVAAGEDQPVDQVERLVGVVDQRRIRRNHQRQSAGALDRIDVRVREQDRGLVPDAPARVELSGADSDCGTVSGHGLFQASGRRGGAGLAAPCRWRSSGARRRSRRSAGTCTARSRA